MGRGYNNTVQLLLVHGALGAAAQLDPLRAALANYDVSVVELEGHGSTPARATRYDMHTFADQIGAAITKPTVVFGYSMGGYAALLLAARAPANLAGVVTLATKFAWSPETAANETSRLDPQKIRAKVPKFADQLAERHRGAGGWEGVLAKTAVLMTELGSRPPIDDDLLAKIQARVLLMVGDRDPMVSIDETAAVARKLSRGQLAVLPETGHPIEVARPALITSLIDDFLRA